MARAWLIVFALGCGERASTNGEQVGGKTSETVPVRPWPAGLEHTKDVGAKWYCEEKPLMCHSSAAECDDKRAVRFPSEQLLKLEPSPPCVPLDGVVWCLTLRYDLGSGTAIKAETTCYMSMEKCRSVQNFWVGDEVTLMSECASSK
jgi:hypothetical protein